MARRVGNAPGSHCGRLGPGGAVIQAVTWGLKARFSSSPLNLLRSGLGLLSGPANPSPSWD